MMLAKLPGTAWRKLVFYVIPHRWQHLYPEASALLERLLFLSVVALIFGGIALASNWGIAFCIFVFITVAFGGGASRNKDDDMSAAWDQWDASNDDDRRRNEPLMFD